MHLWEVYFLVSSSKPSVNTDYCIKQLLLNHMYLKPIVAWEYLEYHNGLLCKALPLFIFILHIFPGYISVICIFSNLQDIQNVCIFSHSQDIYIFSYLQHIYPLQDCPLPPWTGGPGPPKSLSTQTHTDPVQGPESDTGCHHWPVAS